MIKRIIGACLGLCLSAAGIPTPGQFDAKIDRLLEIVQDLQRDGHLDGQVLVVRGDRVLLDVIEDNSKARDRSRVPQFLIGSLSKQFFSAALLKALYDSCEGDEASKVLAVQDKLQQPVITFLPETAALWDGKVPTWAREVTLHHLLSHSSGLQDYVDSPGYSQPDARDPEKQWFQIYHEPEDIIKLIADEPMKFAPGTQYAYCNTNYFIVAQIVEALTGTSSSQYLQEALFDPLEMTSTVNPEMGCCTDLGDGVAPPLLLNPLRPCTVNEDTGCAKGSGSILSSAQDLVKWNKALHRDGRVLPEPLSQLMVTPNRGDYGYGIFVHETPYGPVYMHLGRISSYQSFIVYFPKQDLSIVVLSNISYDDYLSTQPEAKFGPPRGVNFLVSALDRLLGR